MPTYCPKGHQVFPGRIPENRWCPQCRYDWCKMTMGRWYDISECILQDTARVGFDPDVEAADAFDRQDEEAAREDASQVGPNGRPMIPSLRDLTKMVEAPPESVVEALREAANMYAGCDEAEFATEATLDRIGNQVSSAEQLAATTREMDERARTL